MTLKEMLLQDEGLRLKPYRCTGGKLTIGVGRNLEDRGISENEAMMLLDNDIADVQAQCEAAFDFWPALNEARRAVLMNMCFNLGIHGLLKFRLTLQAVGYGDYALAARRMMQSKWAEQVGARAERLAKIMEQGTL